jgi:hypothetical protein
VAPAVAEVAPAVARRVTPVDVDIHNQLDVIMAIVDENQDKFTDGEYLRAMNALGSLHKHKRTSFGAHRPGAALHGWLTHDEICDDDELYEEVMELANDIVVEICGENSSIYLDDDHNMVSRGEEDDVFELVLNYKPEEGNAGYESSPMILHHALQMITSRLFRDTLHELDIVRPVSCPCGWRGVQGNWDRHMRNARHQRWNTERQSNRLAAVMAASASVAVASVVDTMIDAVEAEAAVVVEADAAVVVEAVESSDVVYIYEEHHTPESQIRRDRLVADARSAGKRVVFVPATSRQHFHRTH